MAIPIRTTDIGEYIKHYSCERRLKLDLDDSHERELPFFSRLFNPLDPVLQKSGRDREDLWETQLQEHGYARLCAEEEPSFDDFIQALSSIKPGTKGYIRELSISDTIGEFELSGRIDFILISYEDSSIKLRIVECKGSRKDKTAYRVQVTLYKLLIQSLLASYFSSEDHFHPSNVEIECVVARISEENNLNQNILSLPSLDTSVEEEDCKRLLSSSGSIYEIYNKDFSDISYSIDSKCDSCVKNVYCLAEASRKHSLQLINIKASDIQVLESFGISTIDDLASLEGNTSLITQITSAASFSANIEHLITRAKTRLTNIPFQKASAQPSYPVQQLQKNQYPHLPQYITDGNDLIRIYLSVDYDYVENRVGAISAHIAKGEHHISTPFNDDKSPSPNIIEHPISDPDDQMVVSNNSYICIIPPNPWPGDYAAANTLETKLVEKFFHKLTSHILTLSETTDLPIHFYVWSRSEITHLVEACSRSDSNLLWHFQELLGRRESLEELTFSCVGDEVNRNFALGWTGAGLSVATSLPWFGKRFHWVRNVNSETMELDRTFEQDIFDFKTTIRMRDDETWADESETDIDKKLVEIRSCFFDSLSVPYWHAAWGTLSERAPSKDSRVTSAIKRYNRIKNRPDILKAYLLSRCQALRWIEERLYKDKSIKKTPIDTSSLSNYSLDVNTVAHAARDFVILDHHVKKNDWIYSMLTPPMERISNGRSLPIKDLKMIDGSDENFTCLIDTSSLNLSLSELSNLGAFSEGSFIRIVPHSGNLWVSETIGKILYNSFTAVIKSINWDLGEVVCSTVTHKSSNYILTSFPFALQGNGVPFATMESSVSDYIAGYVDRRLSNPQKGSHIYEWLDPLQPSIPSFTPIDSSLEITVRSVVESILLQDNKGADQVEAIINGLNSRVQLLLGPPGTGKTTTTSISTLSRALIHQESNIIFIGAHTHRAVDNLLLSIAKFKQQFTNLAATEGLTVPEFSLLKIDNELDDDEQGGVIVQKVGVIKTLINNNSYEGTLIVGGTISKLLKLTEQLNKLPAYRENQGFSVDQLIIDEASMMAFPHFLSLASLVSDKGQIMCAGDHRQLSPIMSHDWDNEDRPPVLSYQPHNSAYEAIKYLKDSHNLQNGQIIESPLIYSFRLPPMVRDLISQLYKSKDNLELEGRKDGGKTLDTSKLHDLSAIWECDTGLFLVVHDESDSSRNNVVEAEIIKAIIESAKDDSLESNSIAVVTPHRAQRTTLINALSDYEDYVGTINTVETLQGGERSTVFVSATASDLSTISSSAEFLLDLNRSNVAFSRTIDRLVVVCSQTILDYIPPDIEHYESSMLWKTLRNICTTCICESQVDNHHIRIFCPN